MSDDDPLDLPPMPERESEDWYCMTGFAAKFFSFPEEHPNWSRIRIEDWPDWWSDARMILMENHLTAEKRLEYIAIGKAMDGLKPWERRPADFDDYGHPVPKAPEIMPKRGTSEYALLVGWTAVVVSRNQKIALNKITFEQVEPFLEENLFCISLLEGKQRNDCTKRGYRVINRPEKL